METWEAMKSFTANRDETTVDELWCLEHPRVFTQGQAGTSVHIVLPGDNTMMQVNRRGQVTYHGPGQLVIYLPIDLTGRKLGVRTLVSAIEQAIVRTLAQYDIEAATRSDAPG